MGIDDRANALASSNPSLSSDINLAKERLVGEAQMGELFKTLCIASQGLVPYPFGET